MANRFIPELDEKYREKFWARVNRDGPVPSHAPELGNCWAWNGGGSGKYGTVRVDGDRTPFGAHVIARYLWTGEHPICNVTMHKCDNPNCVNPNHLQLGSHADNTRDMLAKGRWQEPDRSNYPRGDAHWTKRHPALIPRGKDAWCARHPERLARGSALGQAKLTEAAVAAIRARYAAGGITHDDLGRDYGVSRPAITMVLARKTWRHVP